MGLSLAAAPSDAGERPSFPTLAIVQAGCSWWPNNLLALRPDDRAPGQLWLRAEARDIGAGACTRMDRAQVERIHALLGDWLATGAWPSAPVRLLPEGVPAHG